MPSPTPGVGEGAGQAVGAGRLAGRRAAANFVPPGIGGPILSRINQISL